MIIIVIVLESMSGSPPGSYGQLIPSHLNPVIVHDGMHSSVPPVLPPHLLHVILNKEVVDHNDPSLLPEPDHVSLNHLYALSIKVHVCNSTREANDFFFFSEHKSAEFSKSCNLFGSSSGRNFF